MNIHRTGLGLLLLCSGLLASCTSVPHALSESERNGFVADYPLKHIKLAFSVRDSERPIVATIKDASTAIASFAQEMTQTHDGNLVARGSLRLPPEASNGNSRYIQALFYCWELLAQDKLQLQIEWADITTLLRYTDAYTSKGVTGNGIFPVIRTSSRFTMR